MNDDQPHSDAADEEEGSRPRIKVTDRRLFDSQGNPRSQAGEEAALPVESPGSDPTPVVTQPGPGDTPADVTAPPRQASQHRRIVSPQGPSVAETPRDFPAFVESQYLEAMLFLGAVAHPQSGEVVEDLELAKYKIDLLGMLQEKTTGNLTSEEGDFLENALYQLRLLYLQKTKATST
ncbi:MAG: DUF1844 domain-containing protein [Acidobacteriota bacterium]